MADRSVVIRLRGDISDFQSKMRQAGLSAKSGLGDELDKLSGKAGASLGELGDKAGKVGLIAAGGFAAVTAVTANFEQAMSNVAATGEEARQRFDELREAALKAGADTAFSASEAAGGIEALAKAGLSTSDILAGGLDGALDLAAAGTLDVAQAAEIAATTMNQFGLAGDQTSHIADVLSAAAGKAQGEVSDMALSLKYVGPVAAQMGISLEEAAGSVAFLASQGILGDQAGTSLRGMLTSLTSPSKAAAKEMETLGINLYDATGNFVGLEGIAGQLHDTLGGLTNAERDHALGVLFGNEQITAARILYKGGADAIRDWSAAVDDTGFASDTAATKLDNLKGDVEALTGSLETLLITSGEGSQGFLRGVTQGATDAVNAVNGLPGPLKETVVGMLGITAITAGGLWFGSKTIRAVSDTRAALTNLNETSPKTVSALGKIGKAVGFATAAFAAFEIASSLGPDFSREVQRRLTGIDALAGESTQDKIKATSAEIKRLQDILDDQSGLQSFLLGSDNRFFGLGSSDRQADVDTLKALKEQLKDLTSQEETEQQVATRTAAALGLTGQAAGKSAPEIEAMAKAMQEARKAARETAEDFVGLGDSVDDSDVSLDKWLHRMERSAQALHDFRINAKDAAKRGLDDGLIRSLEEAGPAGALRMKQLADATDAEIRRANKAWREGQAEVRRYTRFVTAIPEAHIKVDNHAALLAIRATQEALSGLRGREVVIGGRIARAEGGPVFGPGTGTSDSIPAMLSNGEHVLTAAEVSAAGGHGAIYAMRAALRGYANGGPVFASRPAPSTGGGFSSDVSSTSGGRGAPLVQIETVRHNDMRETVAYARQLAGLASLGGEGF